MKKGKILTLGELIDTPEGTILFVDYHKHGSGVGKLIKCDIFNKYAEFVVISYPIPIHRLIKEPNYRDILLDNIYNNEDYFYTVYNVIQ